MNRRSTVGVLTLVALALVLPLHASAQTTSSTVVSTSPATIPSSTPGIAGIALQFLCTPRTAGAEPSPRLVITNNRPRVPNGTGGFETTMLMLDLTDGATTVGSVGILTTGGGGQVGEINVPAQFHGRPLVLTGADFNGTTTTPAGSQIVVFECPTSPTSSTSTSTSSTTTSTSTTTTTALTNPVLAAIPPALKAQLFGVVEALRPFLPPALVAFLLGLTT